MRDIEPVPILILALALAGCQAAPPGSSPAADAAGSDAAAEASSDGGDAAAATGAPAPAQDARRSRAPQPTPEPTPEPLVVPAGTELEVVLKGTYSSSANQVGDAVLAELAGDVSVGGRLALPAGSEIRGSVTGAKRSGKTKGRARLALGFERVLVDGRSLDLAATGIDVTADDSKGRDAALIGGGAGAGAIVGGIAKGGKGAAIGGLIGGAAGTAAVLTTRGKEVEFPAGTRVAIRLESDLRVR